MLCSSAVLGAAAGAGTSACGTLQSVSGSSFAATLRRNSLTRSLNDAGVDGDFVVLFGSAVAAFLVVSLRVSLAKGNMLGENNLCDTRPAAPGCLMWTDLSVIT